MVSVCADGSSRRRAAVVGTKGQIAVGTRVGGGVAAARAATLNRAAPRAVVVSCGSRRRLLENEKARAHLAVLVAGEVVPAVQHRPHRGVGRRAGRHHAHALAVHAGHRRPAAVQPAAAERERRAAVRWVLLYRAEQLLVSWHCPALERWRRARHCRSITPPPTRRGATVIPRRTPSQRGASRDFPASVS